MTVLTPARSEGLRDERIQSHQQAATKERQHNKNVGAKADGAHGGGAVGEPPDHHSVHYGNAHPAKLGKEEWNGQPQRGAEFGAQCLESNHKCTARGTSLRGTEKRSKRVREGIVLLRGGASSEVGQTVCCYSRAKEIPAKSRCRREKGCPS